MDSEDYQTNFHENRRMKMDAVKIVNKINKEHGTIKNVYFLACGGSLVDLYPGYYFVRAESAVMDAQWIPAREFALTPPKKLGKDSLLIICSHSGKTKECLEAAAGPGCTARLPAERPRSPPSAAPAPSRPSPSPGTAHHIACPAKRLPSPGWSRPKIAPSDPPSRAAPAAPSG